MASVQWSKVDVPSKPVVCPASFLWFSLWFSSLLSGSSVPIFLLTQNLTSNKSSKLFSNAYFTFLFWCCCWHYRSRIPPVFTYSYNRFSLCRLLNWSTNRQVSDKAVQAKTPTPDYNPQKGCDSNPPGLALPSRLQCAPTACFEMCCTHRNNAVLRSPNVFTSMERGCMAVMPVLTAISFWDCLGRSFCLCLTAFLHIFTAVLETFVPQEPCENILFTNHLFSF